MEFIGWIINYYFEFADYILPDFLMRLFGESYLIFYIFCIGIGYVISLGLFRFIASFTYWYPRHLWVFCTGMFIGIYLSPFILILILVAIAALVYYIITSLTKKTSYKKRMKRTINNHMDTKKRERMAHNRRVINNYMQEQGNRPRVAKRKRRIPALKVRK